MVLRHWLRTRLETQAVVSGHTDHPDRVQILRLLKQTWLEWYQSRAFDSSQVVLFGAAFTRVYAKHRGSPPLEPKENAVLVNRKEHA